MLWTVFYPFYLFYLPLMCWYLNTRHLDGLFSSTSFYHNTGKNIYLFNLKNTANISSQIFSHCCRCQYSYFTGFNWIIMKIGIFHKCLTYIFPYLNTINVFSSPLKNYVCIQNSKLHGASLILETDQHWKMTNIYLSPYY